MIQQVVEMLQMFIEAEQKINSNYEGGYNDIFKSQL